MEKEYVVKIVYDTQVSEKRLDDLNKSLEQLQKENKALADSNKKLNDSFDKLSKQSKESAKSQNELSSAFGQLSSKGLDVVGSTNQASKSMLDMGKSVVAATGVIGIIVTVLTGLFAAFASTDKGSKDLAKGLAYLGGIASKITGDIGGLVGKLIDYLSSPMGLINDLKKGFKELSENPVESLKKLGDAIVENIQKRAVGAANVFKSFGGVISNVLKGDLDAAGKSFVDMGDAVIQSATGIENASDSVSNYAKELDKAGDMSVKLAAAEKALAISLSVTQGQLDKLIATQELYQQAADDDTLSFTKRKKAQEDSIATAELVAKKELELANLTLNVAAQRLAADKAFNKSTAESAVAYQEALNTRQTAELAYNTKVAELSTLRRQILSDESEANLDIIIDGWDSAKSVLERQIADAGGSLEEYIKANEELSAASTAGREAQAAIFKKFEVTEEQSIAKRKELNKSLAEVTVKAYKDMESELKVWADRNGDALTQEINLTELATMADSKQLNEKIKSFNLSEKQQVRLLEMIREKRAADADLYDASKALAKEEFELYKKNMEDKAKIDAEYSKNKSELNSLLKEDTYNKSVEELNEYQNSLTEKYAMELDNAIKTGEDTSKISQEYADKIVDIEKAKNNAIIGLTADLLGEAASLFGENTIAFKVLASAQALMNTYLGATAAYAAAAKIEPIVLAPAAAALAVASGLASVAKINGITFADGGNTLAALGGKAQGKSHADGGMPGRIGSTPFEFEGGEYIVNKKATSNNESAIATINALGSTTRFKAVAMYEGGGMIGSNPNAPITAQISLENAFRNAISSMPSPVVSVEDINRVSTKVSVSETNATF